MKKKILIPTDFSKNAWCALTYALELYRNEVCDFFLLNVYSVSVTATGKVLDPSVGELVYNLQGKASLDGLTKLKKKLAFRDDNPKHTYSVLSKYGSLIDSIKETIEKEDIELVVMGAKGTTDALEIVFGGNTVQVMEKVRNCPVLAIPTNTIFIEPKEIVFPTSFETHYKRRELQYLVEIAKLTNASIQVLYVADDSSLDKDQQKNKELLIELLETVKLGFHTVIDKDLQTSLEDFVKNRDSDMIAFINKKHNFFTSIFSRPLVKALGTNMSVPILALHDLRN